MSLTYEIKTQEIGKQNKPVTIVSLEGTLDALTVQDLKPALEEYIGTQNIILDFRQLDTIDASGIGYIVCYPIIIS